MGPAIAYSNASKEFIVTWMGFYTTLNDIHFTRVNLAGAVLQATQRITAGTPDWERDPSVTYNPHTDEFLITYAGQKAYAYIGAQRIKAGSGAMLGAAAELTQTLAAYVPSVAYNTATQNYVVAWYHRSATAAATFGITLRGSDLAVVVPVHLMSSRFFAYDALDMRIASRCGPSAKRSRRRSLSTPRACTRIASRRCSAARPSRSIPHAASTRSCRRPSAAG